MKEMNLNKTKAVQNVKTCPKALTASTGNRVKNFACALVNNHRVQRVPRSRLCIKSWQVGIIIRPYRCGMVYA